MKNFRLLSPITPSKRPSFTATTQLLRPALPIGLSNCQEWKCESLNAIFLGQWAAKKSIISEEFTPKSHAKPTFVAIIFSYCGSDYLPSKEHQLIEAVLPPISTLRRQWIQPYILSLIQSAITLYIKMGRKKIRFLDLWKYVFSVLEQLISSTGMGFLSPNITYFLWKYS